MLRNLIEDTDKVPSVHLQRSVYNKWTPAQYALYQENKSALEILIDDYLNPKQKRVQIPETMFEKFSTGSYNAKSLGVTHIRKLTESRGVREGNQALSKDHDSFRHPSKLDFFVVFSKWPLNTALVLIYTIFY